MDVLAVVVVEVVEMQVMAGCFLAHTQKSQHQSG
jgi:hypothetical protein